MADRAPTKLSAQMSNKFSGSGAMGLSPKQNGTGQDNLVCPALHLYPLNDTFVPKQINLAPPSSRNRIKIGRYSNNKSVPSPTNGYFDSKVLSRAHAEVWSENDKVYIKDVKSSNGTFINGTRLSPESQESEPFELHSEDVVDFGIDILTDDNKEILHHRVACRVFLVITPEDALKLRNDFTSLYRGGIHGGALGNAGISPGAEGGLRRGKPGFNMDNVIFRLQNELQKSKMVGTELRELSSTIQNIHETLGGGLAPLQEPPYPHLVPPRTAPSGENSSSEVPSVDSSAIASLESQLSSTHSMLASHVDKIKGLETTLAAYENIKDEVAALKAELDQTKRDFGEHDLQSHSQNWQSLPPHVRPATDDFDDGSSVASVETTIAPEQVSTIHSESNEHATESQESVRSVPPSATLALLARIEALEQRHTLDISREVIGSSAPEDSVELKALQSRVERLEQALEEQEHAHVPTQEREISLREWRAAFERRWEEQSHALGATQEELKNALALMESDGTRKLMRSSHENSTERDESKKKSWRSQLSFFELALICGISFSASYTFSSLIMIAKGWFL